MKNKILTLLKESTDYVSGQEICEKFNVSRTAVWKAINKLKEEGYNIEAVNNRGYCLVTDTEILSHDKIKALTTGMIQRVIETLMNGKVRDKNVEVVAEMTKERFKDSLAKAKNETRIRAINTAKVNGSIY